MIGKELNYSPKEGDSIILDRMDVKGCSASWQKPLVFGEDGILDLTDAALDKATYIINYEFSNKETMRQFESFHKGKNELAMVYHISGDRVTLYETVTVTKYNLPKAKLAFNCHRWFNVTLRQYRDMKLEAMGDL